MISIRNKLLLGFASLFTVICVIGSMTIHQLGKLGNAIDVILRENYRSVIACQEMKESLERIDSGILYYISGHVEEGERLVSTNYETFEKSLSGELNNITLPGELEKARELERIYKIFRKAVTQTLSDQTPPEEVSRRYFSEIQPLFEKTKGLAQEILVMNQSNMNEANNAAREMARNAYRIMLFAILFSALLAFMFSVSVHRWILKPVQKLIDSADEIRRGNLDLVLKENNRDEIGRLAESFNAMTSALRQIRKQDHIKMLRTQHATENVFRQLPAAVAVLDLHGNVEVTTETAAGYFGLKKGTNAFELKIEWLSGLIQNALTGKMPTVEDKESIIQLFRDNRELFFQPAAMPITSYSEIQETTGILVVIKDVTALFEQRELKRSVISTVSHQLKTPLTSLRMALYLLLEERTGVLNRQQSELLVSARDESDRLADIIDGLLDLNRIAHKETTGQNEAVSPGTLLLEAAEHFAAESRDRGIRLAVHSDSGLPEVSAGRERLRQVFANLITNAFRFTSPGGTITLRAQKDGAPDFVRFSVEDTGTGIASEHLPHLYEQFYRVPGQDPGSGEGLGLSIVREIIRSYGGDVGVESEPGKGSSFSFTLPSVMESADKGAKGE